MYYSKDMTEKARAVIAGEIDMPCPDDGYDEPESTELCAYACTLLRMPGAGMDEDAMELEDIRAFEFGMEHNIDVVWNIMCSLEASTIIIGAYILLYVYTAKGWSSQPGSFRFGEGSLFLYFQAHGKSGRQTTYGRLPPSSASCRMKPTMVAEARMNFLSLIKGGKRS